MKHSEVGMHKETPLELSQLIEWLEKKGAMTAQEKAMLQEGKIPPAPVKEGRRVTPFPPTELTRALVNTP